MSLGRGRRPVRALHPRRRSREVRTRTPRRSRVVRVNPLGHHQPRAVRVKRTAGTRRTAAAHRPRKPMSAAARARLSAARKGKRHPHKGRKATAATRAKLSASLRGRHHKGHRLSAATRAKISRSLSGRRHPHRGVHGHKLAHRTARQRASLHRRRVVVRHATRRRTRHTTTLRRR